MSYRIVILSEALSPITHGARNEGNESIIVRHRVAGPTGAHEVPGISGNSLRNRTLRAPLAGHLVSALELEEKVPADLLYFLHRGGMGGSSGVLKVATRMRARDLLPMVALLGGNLAGGQMLDGDALVSDGVLVCRENAPRLAGMARGFGLWPDDAPRLKPSAEFVGQWQEVGMDPAFRRGGQDLGPNSREDRQFKGMPYGGECVIPGAVFYHDVIVRSDRPEVAGAALFGLAQWQAEGAAVGGGSARGRGRVRSRVLCLGPDGGRADPGPLARSYLAHLEVNREPIAALLAELYPDVAPAKKEPKGKGKGKKEDKKASEGEGEHEADQG